MDKLKCFNTNTVKNIITGYNGSTYILLDEDNLVVIGDNYHGQLGVLSSIIQTIFKCWYNKNKIPMDIVSLIIKHIGKNVFNIDNKQLLPILIQDFKINYISSGIAASHKLIIVGDKLYGSGTNEFSQLGIKASSMVTASNAHSAWNLIELNNADLDIKNIKHISCADTYSIVLMYNGDIYASGYSSRGGLGLGLQITQLHHFKNIDIAASICMVKIECGFDHTLGMDDNGVVYSWGDNSDGQLGQGDDVHFMMKPSKIMYFVENDIRIINIACGSMHCVTLDDNGNVYCFGMNSEWQCGNYDVDGENVYIPDKITNNLDIVDIKAGHYHNVLKTVDNKYYLFGWNQYNQCLVINDRINNVFKPTLFDDTMFVSLNMKIIQIYPGYKETRIVVDQYHTQSI